MPTFTDKLTGAIYGQAIGDAMGAPVEGWPAARIAARFEDVREFLPPTHVGDPTSGKGAGRITDDTLMTEALIRAYVRHGAHLDAYDYEAFMIPEMAETTVWVPERQREMPILERLFWPEKHPWIRLVVNHAEPRSAGMGNRVNCGAAMYVMPIGAVNAGDPLAAYDEATAFTLAHNESFAVEAAGVLAGAAAEAFAVGASPASAVEIALRLARDGTRQAIAAALSAVGPADELDVFVHKVRDAVAFSDQATGHVTDDAPLQPTGVSDIGRPSRLASIEELPVALAALAYGEGDLLKTLRAAVFYGRDCDSIAGMAAALCGALHGADAIPANLRRDVDRANRRDYGELAAHFAETVQRIHTADRARFARREAALNA